MNESIPQDAIHQAAADGNIDLIKEYLTKDPTLVSQFHSTQGTIPLIHAIKENKLEAVECLLAAGSPLDFVDKENNNLLMHFTKNHSDTEKKIKRLLAEHMAKKSSKLRWGLDLPYHISTQALIIILLNLILYHYEKRNFAAKHQLLEELTKQLNVLISPKLSLKDIVDIHFLASNICAQVKSTKETVEYSQTVIHFYIKPLEQASDEERPSYLITLTKVYQQIVALLQEDNNPFAVLPIIKKALDEHHKLYNFLKALTPCSLATAEALSKLNGAINQFNRHVSKLIELQNQTHAATMLILPYKINRNNTSKPCLTNVKITGTQPQHKPTQPNPSTPTKRRIESYNSKPSTSASSFLDNNAKAAGPEAKQLDTKRVRFDIPSKNPSK